METKLKNENLEKINLNVIFVGDPKCGKSSLIRGILYSKYSESTNETVIGLYHLDLEKIDNYKVSLTIW